MLDSLYDNLLSLVKVCGGKFITHVPNFTSLTPPPGRKCEQCGLVLQLLWLVISSLRRRPGSYIILSSSSNILEGWITLMDVFNCDTKCSIGLIAE